jgi:hypothetical protein
MNSLHTAARLPLSGNAALASGALVQAALGLEFVFAGLSKAADADYATHFQGFISASRGSSSGPLAVLIHSVVLPNVQLVAQLSRYAELVGGAVLLLTAVEVLRRRLADPLGAPHAYEPLAALASSVAAFVLGGLSLGIYLLQGGRLPSVNPSYAFSSPIAIELLLVPLALAFGWLEFSRFRALLASGPRAAR